MHQIHIIDGEALRSVLQRVLEEVGTHRKAARRLGIGQTTFTRLLNGITHKKMRSDTYLSIKEALSGHAVEFGLGERFEGSVLTFKGRLVRDNYESWLHQEFQRLERKVGPLLTVLLNHFQCATVFDRFLERQTRRPDLPQPDDERLWIALYRAVEPLVEAKATWGVEWSWEELDAAGHLGRFVRAGLEREQIMLSRERDEERLNKCTPPEEFLAWLAGADEEEQESQPSME